MGQTIAEKIISKHAGYDVKAGELCIAKVDNALNPVLTTLFLVSLETYTLNLLPRSCCMPDDKSFTPISITPTPANI